MREQQNSDTSRGFFGGGRKGLEGATTQVDSLA